MEDQNHRHRKFKRFPYAGHNKQNTHSSPEDAETCHMLIDDPSHLNMSKNDTFVTNSSLSNYLTLYEKHILEQDSLRNGIKNASFSELSLCTDKNDSFGTGAYVTTCKPSFSNQLTLHELYETLGCSWKKNRQSKAANSDNKESDRDSNNYLTLYELYKMQGFECNSQKRNLTQREFIPNPANKEFYVQCRKKRMDKIPEWIKSIWEKQSNQQKSEGSKTTRFSEKESMEADEQQNNIKHKSFHPSANHVQENITEAGNLSIHMQQSCAEQQTTSNNPVCKVLGKSPENAAKENGGRDINFDSNVTKAVKLSENHEKILEAESEFSSVSDEIPLSYLPGKERLSKKDILQKEKDKIQDENSERLAGWNSETVSDKEKSFCENMDQEHLIVKEWNEWSVKLLKDGQLCITGRCNGASSVSEDVSQWKRIDAHTLKNPKEGIIYKLVGIPDHYIGTDLPGVIQKKFQNGFPEDWLEVVRQWNDMLHKGGNAKQTELMLESTDSDVSDACADPSLQWQSSCLNASKIRSQEMLKYAKVVVKKLEFSRPGYSSFRTVEKGSSARQDIQQQPKLSNESDRIRGISFPRKDQASHQLKYKVTLRRVPDAQSSFDETDTSFI